MYGLAILTLLYVFNRIEQISKCTMDNENWILLWKKQVTNKERGKANMNSVVLY